MGQERRYRWSPEQKPAMVGERLELGQSVSVVARRNGIHALKQVLETLTVRST
ncbi:Mobile element protein [Pseudomonas chlororaphis subsp. aurantiaca]|nr:Mobile element protein [Pseudomonas chlororaphis subsp. aurantiaca]AZD91398.1 Mobile element protein [Pseudomonas chlororaphis subsp. aureofaciens]PWY37892.1 hypothetical protein DK261_23915 [Pseudomonas sp. RW409]TSD31750.1 transposase [Pseudomonas sp. ATCC 13985]AZD41074.1 Mobile element protein [Pseudomonas chlororaphis subsp. aurantiaca]